MILRHKAAAKAARAAGAVFWLLTAHGKVDAKQTEPMIAPPRHLEHTYHRAFQLTRDQVQARGRKQS